MTLRLARERVRFQGDNPARVYLATLSPGSHWAMTHALETIASLLTGGEDDAETLLWWELRYRDTIAVRNLLAERYQPATVNKMLAALRGVLKQAWRLGLVDAETYRRTVDVPNLKGRALQRGRALSREEIRALFAACAEDASPAGRRDAALLAVLYGCGLRRAEAVGLVLGDLDLKAKVLTVRQGKRRKDRTAYLTPAICRLLRAWIKVRGSEPGALFCPVDSSGRIAVRRMRGECLSYILRRRQEQAGFRCVVPSVSELAVLFEHREDRSGGAGGLHWRVGRAGCESHTAAEYSNDGQAGHRRSAGVRLEERSPTSGL